MTDAEFRKLSPDEKLPIFEDGLNDQPKHPYNIRKREEIHAETMRLFEEAKQLPPERLDAWAGNDAVRLLIAVAAQLSV